jgi:hypothetical protein
VGEERTSPGGHPKTSIPLTGRIKGPLRGPRNTEGAPHQINTGLGDRIVFTIGRVNRQRRNILINKVGILAPLEILLEIRGAIFIQGGPLRTDEIWITRIGLFKKVKIGVPHLDEIDPHTRGHNTNSLPKDPLHRGQDFPLSNQISLHAPQRQIYPSNNGCTIVQLMNLIRDRQ